MKEIIEHEGKKYRVVGGGDCPDCAFEHTFKLCNKIVMGKHDRFPSCHSADCHFELVEETNEKE